MLEWYYIVLIVILALLVFFFVMTYFQAKKASIKVTEVELKQNMRKGQLLDVRTEQEFKSGHINGARNMPVNTLAREYKKLRTDQPIYLYCASGKRSSRAAMYLHAKGFNEIYELEGGIKSWSGPLK